MGLTCIFCEEYSKNHQEKQETKNTTNKIGLYLKNALISY